MTTATKPKAPTPLDRLTRLITGLQTSPPSSTKSLLILGKSYTIAQLIALLVPIQTILQAVSPAKTAWSKAVAAVKAQAATFNSLMAAIRVALIQAYGTDTEGLAACGFTVKTRAKRTSAQNIVSSKKAKATRQANGTGKKAPQPTITVTAPDGSVIGPSSDQPAAAPAPAAANAPAGAAAPAAPAAPGVVAGH